MAAADPLQLLINSMAEVAQCIDHPAVAQSIGDGLAREILYAVATCRQRFPGRWPGGQQQLVFDDGASEP
jgi:hypothetical protein